MYHRSHEDAPVGFQGGVMSQWFPQSFFPRSHEAGPVGFHIIEKVPR